MKKSTSIPDRLPPHDIENEMAAIGCLLLAPEDCFDEWIETTKHRAEVFYDLRNQNVFSAMLELFTERKRIEILSVCTLLKTMDEKIDWLPHLSKCSDSTPSAHLFTNCLEIILGKFQLRKLIQTGTELVSAAYESNAESETLRAEAETKIAEYELKSIPVLNGINLAHAVEEDLEQRMKLAGALSGIPTGITRFDKISHGLQLREQTIIGARPSVGKTAFALKAFCHAAIENKIPTLFISLEMTPEALVRRMISMNLEIGLKNLRAGDLTPDEIQKISWFNSSVLAKAPIYIVNAVAGMNTDDFDAIVRRHVRRHGVKFVIVDYLQKMKAMRRNEKRTYEVGDVSSSTKATAEKNKVALMMLAQLNREMEKEKGRRPRLSDLGDSKQIECDGDLIGLLHRPRSDDDPNGENAMLIVAKQRDGELDKIDMHYEGKFCRFENP